MSQPAHTKARMCNLVVHYAAFFIEPNTLVSQFDSQSLLAIEARTCSSGCTPSLLHLICCWPLHLLLIKLSTVDS